MGGLVNMFNALATIFGVRVSTPWLPPLIMLGFFVVFLPKIWNSQREGEVRRKLARASMERRDERERQEQILLDSLAKEPSALLSIAETGLQMNRADLARAAMSRVPDTLQQTPRAQAIWRQLNPPVEMPKTLDEGLLKAERLIQSGAFDSAREVLGRLESRWGMDPEIIAVRSSLPEHRSPEQPS